MPDILHKVAFKSSAPDDGYKALTTLGGLAGWWTTDTTGGEKVGDVIRFRFGPRGGFDMKIVALEPARRVLWEVVDGPEEWIGTTVSFDLRREDDFTVLLFRHGGWREPVEFMSHCSTKWAVFLMSLKSLVETGKAAPYPNDVHVDNWG